MEEFFVQCWEDGSKPNVTQGRRFINHILTNYGKPPLNRAPTGVRFWQAVSFASFRGWQVVGGKVRKSAAVKGCGV